LKNSAILAPWRFNCSFKVDGGDIRTPGGHPAPRKLRGQLQSRPQQPVIWRRSLGHCRAIGGGRADLAAPACPLPKHLRRSDLGEEHLRAEGPAVGIAHNHQLVSINGGHGPFSHPTIRQAQPDLAACKTGQGRYVDRAEGQEAARPGVALWLGRGAWTTLVSVVALDWSTGPLEPLRSAIALSPAET